VEVRTESKARPEFSVSPSVGICVLNWNGWSDTLECVESLRQQDYPNFVTIVLDNHSLNDSVEQIRAWTGKNLPESWGFAEYPGCVARAGGEGEKEANLGAVKSPDRLVLICNEDNTGFTGGCNAVIDYALHRSQPLDYVFLLNNDATLEPDCLSQLIAVAQESGEGIVGAVMYDETGKHPFFNGRISMTRQFFFPIVNWHLPPPVTHEDFWPSDCAHGGAMMMRADALGAVHAATGNYFREGLFMYNEGAEFQYHAARAGHHTVIARKAVVYHKNARSSGGTENPIAYYYTERSRLLVANVVLPFGWKALFHLVNLPLVTARILKNVIRRRTVAAKAILEGVLDGYRGREGKWRRHDERLLKRNVF
jgi:GT2 family glycosyltransferase